MIEAMKQARELVQRFLDCDSISSSDYLDVRDAIDKAIREHAMYEVQRLGQEIEQEPVAWLLTEKNINSLQVDSIQRLISRLNHAHHTDLCVRINGQDEWFEADWLKHMVRVTPPAQTQRTWVGLTDEEVKDIVWNLPYEPSQEHIRAIEAKLREKNT